VFLVGVDSEASHCRLRPIFSFQWVFILLMAFVGSTDASLTASANICESLWSSLFILCGVLLLALGVVLDAKRRKINFFTFQDSVSSVPQRQKRPTFWPKIRRFHRLRRRPKLQSSQFVRHFLFCAVMQLCPLTAVCSLILFVFVRFMHTACVIVDGAYCLCAHESAAMLFSVCVRFDPLLPLTGNGCVERNPGPGGFTREEIEREKEKDRAKDRDRDRDREAHRAGQKVPQKNFFTMMMQSSSRKKEKIEKYYCLKCYLPFGNPGALATHQKKHGKQNQRVLKHKILRSQNLQQLVRNKKRKASNELSNKKKEAEKRSGNKNPLHKF